MSRQYDARQEVLKAHPTDRKSGVDMFLGYLAVSEKDFAYEEGMSSEEYIYGKDNAVEENPKFSSDIEIAARALNMKLHGATELGQRTQWIAEALMVERNRNVKALEPCMKCGRNRTSC